MDIQEIKKIIDRDNSACLMLSNEYGECLRLGQPYKVARVGSKLKMQWPVTFTQYGFPFTFAVLHRGDQILNAKEITPVMLSKRIKHLEITFEFK
jgi:hypothetical protein